LHADAGSAADSALPSGLLDASDAQHSASPRDADIAPLRDADARVASPGLFLRLPDPVANLPRGAQQLARLCARGRDDAVTDAFCGENTPRPSNLSELFALLDVDPHVYNGPSRGFSITGHSTSLSKRSVSAINPRVIFIHLESSTEPLLAVAFTRGEPLVEIVTRNRGQHELQFYVVAFRLPCADAGRECTPGELLTSAVEKDWQSVDVYGEEDLKNTPVDCRVCHQTNGPGTAKILRMQEFESPWTHWFDDQTRGGRALLADYDAAHGAESYAGIPGYVIGNARGGLTSAFVSTAGSRLQPNEFASAFIESEVETSAPEQPMNNQKRGESDTWRALYQTTLRAEAIPTPYHDVKITDPAKLATMQQAYAAYLAGRLAQNALPDIRDVFPDEAVTLAEMGFTLDERLDDRALMTAACGLCHNGRLDQTLSRARFHTDLERLSAEEKQTAIDRLSLAEEDPLAMPPRRIHAMSDAARARLVALLRK
jgi:hypothetical protein